MPMTSAFVSDKTWDRHVKLSNHDDDGEMFNNHDDQMKSVGFIDDDCVLMIIMMRCMFPEEMDQ